MSVSWQIKCTDGKKDPVSLGVGKTVIGRGHLLQIRELKVSRHHAEVQINEDGEFILKAMHPGLPCFFKKGDAEQKELSRGATVKLENDDIFSLHSNPDCEFKVLMIEPTANNGTDDTETKQDATESKEQKKDESEDAEAEMKEENEEEEGEEEEGEEEEAEEDELEEEEDEDNDGSDWNENEIKKKKKTPSKPRTQRSDRRNKSASSRRKKPPSSDEEVDEPSESSGDEEEPSEEEEEDLDFGRRSKSSRRQPARNQSRLPSRRNAAKSVNYNEDVMYGDISLSEPEEEVDDGLPKIGRQKRRQSDSDFEAEDDSGSDWEDNRKSHRKAATAPKPVSRAPKRGSKRKPRFSDSEELSADDEEYIPRPSKRRSAAAVKRKDSSPEESEEVSD